MKDSEPRPLLGSTAWMFAGHFAKLALQVAAFVLLARVLEPAGFGVFAASVAIAGLLAPFVDLGAYSLIVRDVSNGISTARAVGTSFVLSLALLPVGLGILALAKLVFLPGTSWTMVVLVGVASFLGARWGTIAGGAHVGNHLLWRNALLETFRGLVQLSAVALLLLPYFDADHWPFLYCGQALLSGGISLLWVRRTWGPFQCRRTDILPRLQPGAHFAVSLAAQSAYNDLDKALIARLSTLEATGIYSAAHRLVQIGFLPINAVLGATYPRFFNAGAGGYPRARSVAWSVLPVTLALGALGATALWLLAPWAPAVLGTEYDSALGTIRLLAPVLVLQGAYMPFADAMSGSGQQRSRSIGQVVGLIVNLACGVMMIPGYGWRGAAFASLLTHGVLAAYFLYPRHSIPTEAGERSSLASSTI